MDCSAFEAEWHPTKNLPLVFSTSLSMSWKYWWLGECGHEWEATLNKRTGKGSGCLVCSSFALVYPDLAAEWHPTKNGDLTPIQMSAKAIGKYWWLGACGHEWEATLYKRIVGKSSGCLVCSSLAVVRPDLAAEWHPTKNGDLVPAQISAKDTDKYWWVGECGHEWEAHLVQRLNGKNNGCLVCSTFAVVYPDLAAEWHPTKNGEITPAQISAKASDKYWWLGACGHEWQDCLDKRKNGRSCLFCSGAQLLIGFNDFVTLHPKLASELHPTKNGDLMPEQFLPTSTTKVWWVGKKCGHEWETSFTSRSKGIDCPYCANRILLVGFNDLATVNPSLASEWHPTKNAELTPEDVTSGAGSWAWWLGACEHEWKAVVGSRNRGGSNCPVCNHPERYDKELLRGINDLASVKPEIAVQWHPTKNGNLTPDAVVRMFDEKVWWVGSCGYEWEATPKSRKTSDCPECKSARVQHGVNDLGSVDPVIAAEWHPIKNSPLTLRHISVGSEKKVWWLCSEGHEWEAMVKNRASKKIGCPDCSGRKKFNGRTFAGRNLVLGINDLATVSPEAASEWHPTKNGDLTPQQVTDVSHKKVWWLGACGHEWEYEVRHRVHKGYGCRICK